LVQELIVTRGENHHGDRTEEEKEEAKAATGSLERRRNRY